MADVLRGRGEETGAPSEDTGKAATEARGRVWRWLEPPGTGRGKEGFPEMMEGASLCHQFNFELSVPTPMR